MQLPPLLRLLFTRGLAWRTASPGLTAPSSQALFLEPLRNKSYDSASLCEGGNHAFHPATPRVPFPRAGAQMLRDSLPTPGGWLVSPHSAGHDLHGLHSAHWLRASSTPGGVPSGAASLPFSLCEKHGHTRQPQMLVTRPHPSKAAVSEAFYKQRQNEQFGVHSNL